MKVRWNAFTVIEHIKGGFLLKNTETRGVLFLDNSSYKEISRTINEKGEVEDELFDVLGGDNSILVQDDENEVESFFKTFISTRDNGTKTFTLHLIPTVRCQLACPYCFENGSNRKGVMKESVVEQALKWLDGYFLEHELDRFKVVLFGGEPLLGKNIIKYSLPKFRTLAERFGLEFCTELVTNGELLTENMALFFREYDWNRLQITLDGPKDVHNLIRCGRNGRPTFDSILQNIRMVLEKGYISSVDVRVNYSCENSERISELLDVLAKIGLQDKISLSFGMIMPTSENRFKLTQKFETKMAKSYLRFCSVAKELGFRIPREYSAGPWCVAVEKHSIVLQPNGTMHKCISTAGRNMFAFSDVFSSAFDYAKDDRFEQFERMEQCKKEKCPYLPICGAGCPWDAMVADDKLGFGVRSCRKRTIDIINRGLLRLNHSE